MPCRTVALAALAAVLLAACDDRGITDPAAARPPASPLAAVAGGQQGYAYTCGLSIAPSQSTANQQIDSIYAQWKQRYIRDAGGALRVSNGTVSHDTTKSEDTFSEGIGYGMLIAAYMDDRPLFDGLWAYAKRYQVTFKGKSGLMAWHINRDGAIVDSAFATDGD